MLHLLPPQGRFLTERPSPPPLKSRVRSGRAPCRSCAAPTLLTAGSRGRPSLLTRRNAGQEIEGPAPQGGPPEAFRPGRRRITAPQRAGGRAYTTCRVERAAGCADGSSGHGFRPRRAQGGLARRAGRPALCARASSLGGRAPVCWVASPAARLVRARTAAGSPRALVCWVASCASLLGRLAR